MMLPHVKALNKHEDKFVARHKDMVERIQQSRCYLGVVVEKKEVESYADRLLDKAKRPALKDLYTNVLFFPEELQGLFHPMKKAKRVYALFVVYNRVRTKDVSLDKLLDGVTDDPAEEDDEDKPKPDAASDEEPQPAEEEEEEENDYVDNYFDNGEGDDVDDASGGEDYY
jgi:DNA-directed RNA polymerase III subunit RPC7